LPYVQHFTLKFTPFRPSGTLPLDEGKGFWDGVKWFFNLSKRLYDHPAIPHTTRLTLPLAHATIYYWNATGGMALHYRWIFSEIIDGL